MAEETKNLLNKISQRLFDKKGVNIFVLDVQGISTLTDYFIIAEGNIERHVQALAKEVVAVAKEMGYEPLHQDGMKNGDWVVVDLGSVVVHLFSPGIRDKYSLEELWHEGEIVDVEIVV